MPSVSVIIVNDNGIAWLRTTGKKKMPQKMVGEIEE